MSAAQSSYAVIRARIEVRLAELREALERHEAEERWDEREVLERVERGLAGLMEEVARP